VKSIDQAHTNAVYSVSYSPNGRILVSASYDRTMKIWDAETFELKHRFEQEFVTKQLTITADSNFIVSANTDKTVRITPCREYHITCLTPILNLILHIVYKRDYVKFPKHSRRTPNYAHTLRLLGECVNDGGYNVTSEILSFLSPAHLPVQITPTRWKRDPDSLILFMKARFEENDATKESIIDEQRNGNNYLRQVIVTQFEQDGEEEDSEPEENGSERITILCYKELPS